MMTVNLFALKFSKKLDLHKLPKYDVLTHSTHLTTLAIFVKKSLNLTNIVRIRESHSIDPYLIFNKTAELWQRRPRDAPNIWVP